MSFTGTRTVEKLEAHIERVIAEVFMRMGLKRLPLRPSRWTMHPMVNAVVAVCEAVAKGQQPGRGDDDEQRTEP